MRKPDHTENATQEEEGTPEVAAGETEGGFEAPETPERAITEAEAAMTELEAQGVPVAEDIAFRLGAAVDEATRAELGEVSQEAERAMSELNAELSNADSERFEKQETIRETREYRGSDGKLLGTGLFEFAPEVVEKSSFKTPDGRPGTCRKLLSFKMQGEKDGKKTETDLLSLAVAGKTEVWIATEVLSNYYSESKEGYVTAPPLDTTVGIAVLFHELGHSDQSREERFSQLKQEEEDAALVNTPRKIPEALAQIRAVFPEVGEAIDRIDAEYLNALEETLARAAEAGEKSSALERLARSTVSAKEKILSSTLRAAFQEKTGGDIDQFGERLQEATEAERAALLEGVGFEFDRDAAPVTPAPASRKIQLGRKTTPPSGLSRENGASPEVAPKVLKAFRFAGLSDVQVIDETAGLVHLKLPMSVAGENRFVTLKIPVSAELLGAMKDRHAEEDAKAALFHAQAEEADAERQSIRVAYDAKLEERQVRALLNLPRNVLERDATRRAFEWMRKLRNEGGVDLFAKSVVPESALFSSKAGACQPLVAEALAAPDPQRMLESDVQTDLSNALKSYGARAFRIKNRDDANDIGVMPRPAPMRGSTGKSV